MSKLATFWTGDLSAGFPASNKDLEEVGGKPTRKAMLRNIEQLLSAKWGGVTITRVRGVWWDDESTCAEEFGYKFEVYFHLSSYSTVDWVEELRNDARFIANVLKQKEVHLTIADVMLLEVTPAPHTGPSRMDA